MDFSSNKPSLSSLRLKTVSKIVGYGKSEEKHITISHWKNFSGVIDKVSS